MRRVYVRYWWWLTLTLRKTAWYSTAAAAAAAADAAISHNKFDAWPVMWAHRNSSAKIDVVLADSGKML